MRHRVRTAESVSDQDSNLLVMNQLTTSETALQGPSIVIG